MSNYTPIGKELKLKYNFNIERIKKAEKYFENASDKDIDKYLDNFMNIVKELDCTGMDLQKILGRNLTQDEILEGFKEV